MLAMSFESWVGVFLFIVVWVLLAFWPARVAGRKGHSFVGYFVLSLFFFPLALIMAYAVKDRMRFA
jgi:cytochrome b